MRRYGWDPYVPMRARRGIAAREILRLRKSGRDVEPVEIEGRTIARSFWGAAWCAHLEKFSDYSNRLPRGRRYARNGSVIHLGVGAGRIEGLVVGSAVYHVTIEVKRLPKPKWSGIKRRCTGRIGSLLDLLQGKLSDGVMQVVTDRDGGLFPAPRDIDLDCSCPDWAYMCKHVAAVLYGVGARLDAAPELLFRLRGVDEQELIAAETGDVVAALDTPSAGRRLSEAALSDVFGIELAEEPIEPPPPPSRRGRVKQKAAKRAAKPATTGKKARKKAKKAAKKTVRKKPAPPGRRPRSRPKATATRRIRVVRRSRQSPAPRPAAGSRSPTASAVARLRARFGMTRPRFARLLGVSSATVSNWENADGRLTLQARTLKAWQAAAKLTKREAWRRLEGV